MTTRTNTGLRSARGRIEVDATPEEVWRALTDAAELVRWFPLEARVEPGEGGSVYMSWKNEFAGDSAILAWEPARRLVISWGWDDAGDHPPQLTEYRIETGGGRTVVDVVTSGFPDDPSWDAYVESTNSGWKFELRSLKEYLERHAGEERDVVYLRRRTPIEADEAWNRVFSPEGLGPRPLAGEVFDERAGRQYAALVDTLGGALFRVSMEPCMVDPELRDVTLWLQAWGDARDRLPAIEAEWRALLERLFPGGETV